MAIGLYTDVHIPKAIIAALRSRGVDVLTSVEDETRRMPDAKLLDRATHLGRALYTMDADLLVEAMARKRGGRVFSGVIYSHQNRSPLGRCIGDLEIIAKSMTDSDLTGFIEYIPF